MAKAKKSKKTEESTEVENVVGGEDDLINSLILDLNTDGDVMTLENATHASVPGWIPSGDPALDEALGGGWPLSRIVEVYGPESNGKTTVALHAIAEVQKIGGIAIFLDTEHALDRTRAKSIGVDLKTMIYAQPGTMESVFEFVDGLIDKIRKKNVERPILVVWDSVAATPTNVEVNGEYDDQHVGIHARVMSQGFRKINSKINKNNVCFMCINQTRDKVGVTFGEKSTTPGGRALKFYASVRLEVIKVGQYKEGSAVAGIKCIANTKKNKVAPPFRKVEFNILFADENGGIDGLGSLLDKGLEAGIFGTSKGWYEIDGQKFRKADARTYLREHPETVKTLRDTLLSL
ncbi:protein RecA [Bacillus phage vB_BsuM-Goe26]|nr:protein RecA [Bacillus phage vB_BsuM-Goe26]